MAVKTKGQIINNINPHCYTGDNLLKDKSGYHIIDYGGSLRFIACILRWHKELAEVLCIK